MRIADVALLSLCAGMASAAEVGDSFLRDFAITQRYKLGTVTAPLPTADGSAVLFVRSEPRRPWGSLYRFDVKSGQTRKLLAPEDVLKGAEEQLSAAERAQRERQR